MMKKFCTAILTIMLIVLALPVSALASVNVEPPQLKAISFNNAKVVGEIEQGKFGYSLELIDPSVTPTLKSYSISDDANIFVNYALDDAKHQTGIIVEVRNDNIQTLYEFDYLNARKFEKNSNNNLSFVTCYLGEVYPALSSSSTEYSLYVPNDLTEINLSAAAEDIGAYCEVPGTIVLKPDQDMEINIPVTASNGTTKTYIFKVKRLDKSTSEVIAQMNEPGFVSIVDGELFYQKPAFKLISISVIGGVIILLLLLAIFKRVVIKAHDDDEKDFFIIE